MSQDLLSAESPSPVVTLVNGEPRALSIDVAGHFNKRHDDVLRAIQKLTAELAQLGPERLRNFAETMVERTNPKGGKPIPSPAYLLSRDGFTLLAMGFTGKRALAWKLRYIEAFNAMEKELTGPATDTEPLALERSTVGDRKPLAGLVDAWVRARNPNPSGADYNDAWRQVAARFSLSRVRELPAAWVPDACAFVQERIDALALGAHAPLAPAGGPALPPEPPALATARDREPLRLAVAEWCRRTGMSRAEAWTAVKHRFGIQRIDHLPLSWLEEALSFVARETAKNPALPCATPAPRAFPMALVGAGRAAVHYPGLAGLAPSHFLNLQANAYEVGRKYMGAGWDAIEQAAAPFKTGPSRPSSSLGELRHELDRMLTAWDMISTGAVNLMNSIILTYGKLSEVAKEQDAMRRAGAE
jgi:Rha family phage regulatory protein